MSNFALVQINPFSVIAEWQTIPDPVVWPDGNASHAVSAGFAHGNWRVVPVVYTPDAPNEFYEIESTAPTYNGTAATFVRTWAPMSLSSVKKELASRIDRQAEDLRLEYITPGAGQALTYFSKEQEAKAFLSDQSPDPANYPFLSATIGADGAALADVAKFVSSTAASWRAVGASIERIRRGSKKQIADALSVDDAFSVYSKVSWTP